MRILRAMVVFGVVGLWAVWTPGPAQASCHAFAISVSPAAVTEGSPVTVTVSRDGSVADSQVVVSGVDGTAHAGSDYVGLPKTVAFTGTELSKAFAVSTIDDAVPEPDKTFSVHLSSGGGCTPPPHFAYGPDAVVTIRDNDVATTVAPTTRTTPTTAKTTTSLRSTTTTSTTVAAAVTTEATTTSSTEATTSTTLKKTSKSSGVSPLLIGLIVVVVGALGATAVALNRRQRAGRP